MIPNIFNLCKLDIREDILYRVIRIFNYINNYRKENQWKDFFSSDLVINLINTMQYYSSSSKNEDNIEINYYLKLDLSESKINEIKKKLEIKNKGKNIDEIFENNYNSTFQNFIRYICKIECIKILKERNTSLSFKTNYCFGEILNYYVFKIVNELIDEEFNLKLANELAKILLIAWDYIKKGFHINELLYIDKPDYLLLISDKSKNNIIQPIELTSIYPSYIFPESNIYEQKQFKKFIKLLINKWNLSKITYNINNSKNIQSYIKDSNLIKFNENIYLSKNNERFVFNETSICYLPTSNDFCFDELKWLLCFSLNFLRLNKQTYIEKLDLYKKKQRTIKF